jgi:hypothetical protein
MQFSHIVSLLFAAATRSGMKDDHLAGHSCFRTYYIARKHHENKYIKTQSFISMLGTRTSKFSAWFR